jgi:type II restriction enzyme
MTKITYEGKGQVSRLSQQHTQSGGVSGIFGVDARSHDLSTKEATILVKQKLMEQFPQLNFRIRRTLPKSEIHSVMNNLDRSLGQQLFVATANIQPDGGILEVQDKYGNWRVILVSEAKHQGNDVANILAGNRTAIMAEKDQYIMPAGNAIERVHKNIQELKNYMLGERYFPYVVLLKGSNFAVMEETFQWLSGGSIRVSPNDAALNRIDRVTAANYGLPINQNYCENKYINFRTHSIMLQVTSIYAQLREYTNEQLLSITYSMAMSSLEILRQDLV